MSSYTDFAAFSNTRWDQSGNPGTYGSLEDIHNDIQLLPVVVYPNSPSFDHVPRSRTRDGGVVFEVRLQDSVGYLYVDSLYL